ncbi:potassium transporter TrkA [Persicimonas caeni]|uniref:Potassium transporter TrkA n=1 Tax=Persicimonas caeni TaxID=2292766 RepID=A0A4Y6PQH8_PERCE|nr:NAD-binding protein [Persicimonas caeni]QDG50574.1 potassium transporter TrkA [Persicimonas caeni]QED31795.1 potassium transporter TrkA [Persicimonas caeni]
MKTISTQLSHFLENKELRRNLPLLMKFIGLLVVVIIVFTVLFHFIMLYVEGEEHSWITGLYWTLTVMSTLGFGDITFQSDIGRAFSVVVLVTGIVMLLIVLPFAFIRFFYAPWLEAQIRTRAPRELPPDTRGHVIICARDAISPQLTEWLEREDIPYVLIEPDPTTASEWYIEGLSTLIGEIDSHQTYTNARANAARLVVANHDDIVNTNITLTVREVAPDVPIAAVSADENAVDILELSGVTHVLPLKRWLGEQLANRINAQRAGLHPLGEYGDLKIAELPVHNTPLAGKTIRETRLREETGVSIVGVWERGPLQSADPNRELTEASVPVVIGEEEQLEQLDSVLANYDVNPNPVLVIGGGTVGEAAVRSLRKKNVPVHLVERDSSRCKLLRELCDQVYCGDASDYSLLKEAGIDQAPSVLLTTNDDAVNIYLTSYCRRLNDELRIVSRITHGRNLEAMYRAGADFVLSYATLGVDAITSILRGKKLIVLGEGVDLFARQVPPSLRGKTLAESGIGAMTGMSVVALKRDDETISRFSPSIELEEGMEILLIGSSEQAQRFNELYG